MEKIRIKGEFELEGVFKYGEKGGKRACVICHPHPQFGGDMYNNVVLAIRDGLADAGIATLRFNFRGVGGSGGEYSDGQGEVEDVKAALGFLRERGFESLAIAGYSFGSYVGFRAGIDEDVKLLIGVALPHAFFDFSFMEGCGIPVGIIAGDEDQFCPPKKLKNFLQSLKFKNEYLIVPSADHFMIGKEAEVRKCVTRIVETILSYT